MTHHEFFHHLIAFVKHALDLISITVTVGAIVNLLPPLAAAMSIAWLGLQTYAWFRRKAWMTDQEIREAAQAELDKKANP
jgi:TctA family transporter